MENADQFPDDFLKLSLFPPFTEDSVVDAEPISYCLHHRSTVDFTLSLFPQVSENLAASKPITTTVDFSSIDGGKDHPYSPFLTLFTQVCENFAASKPNIPLPLPPATDLCLSLPSVPETTTQCSIGSQDSSGFATSSGEVNASAPKRSLLQVLGEEKFVALKKINLRNESTTNKTKWQRLIIRQAASGEEGRWITKKLTKSDVNGSSRLFLPHQEVNNYILPFMDEEEQSILCQQLCRLDVTVFDMDTNTDHILTFKKWATGNLVLVKAWTPDFVKGRNLKENDVISIRWEKTNSRFCFRVDTRNQVDL